MSEAERFCDEKTTVLVPSIALNYDGNMLESVGIGGEMFRRETPLSAENTRLRAENAKLHDLIEAVLQCAGETKRDKGCDACPMWNENDVHGKRWCLLRPTLRKVGFEVGEWRVGDDGQLHQVKEEDE